MASPEANLTRRWRALLLLVLFALGLACLALPEAAESGVATAWVRSYNGPANGWNNANALALDSRGNVYVTGASQRSGRSEIDDYLTIKYSPKGKCLWMRRYHGPLHTWGNGDSSATAIAVDGEDNIYVTGMSAGGRYGGDCATIKYSPDGKELWVQRYRHVDPVAIAVDKHNNVYIAGWDYTAIKYSPDGRQLWVKRCKTEASYPWDHARAMALDAQGNVYVTGSSGGPGVLTGYLTVKYSSDGEELWLRRYSAGYDVDWARAIAVDGRGNVYVSGESVIQAWPKTTERYSSYLTVKYDTGGQLLWTHRYEGHTYQDLNNPSAMTLDAQGNAYVTGVTGYWYADYLTVKYSPEGQPLWARLHFGPESPDYECATAIAADTEGSVYVTGRSHVFWQSNSLWQSNFCFLTLKYNPDGDEMWARFYDRVDDPVLGETPSAIAVDGQGAVYVVGTSSGDYRHGDYFVTIKYIQSPRMGR